MTRQFASNAEKRRAQKQQRFNARRDWSDDEIRTEFDCNPNLTVATLAFMTGKTTEQIKKILLED
jgi:hypothetical protein